MTEDTYYPEMIEQFRKERNLEIKRINNRMNLFEIAHQTELLKNCGRITIIVGKNLDEIFQDLNINFWTNVEFFKNGDNTKYLHIPESINNLIPYRHPEHGLHHTEMKFFVEELYKNRLIKRAEPNNQYQVNDVLIFTHCYELIEFFARADEHKIVRLIRVENYPDNPRFVEYPPNELLYLIESCAEIR